jgi:hypothetical protein
MSPAGERIALRTNRPRPRKNAPRGQQHISPVGRAGRPHSTVNIFHDSRGPTRAALGTLRAKPAALKGNAVHMAHN